MKSSYNVTDDFIEPEIAEYLDFLNSVDLAGEEIVTTERIDKNFDMFLKAVNTLITYPDLLVDLMVPADSHFSLYFYQRMVLRTMNRKREVYVAATRAASKSFLAFLSRYITCMLLPGHKAFIVADVKKQGASIAKEKVVEDLWVKFPLLENEMQKRRVAGKVSTPYILNKDEASFTFTSGSKFDVVGNGESVRGGRRHSGIIEEVINQDPTALNERIIPLMNVYRRNKLGKQLPNEPHAAKLYVTTAGYQGTFAYDKLLETLCNAALNPDKYSVMGMSYKVPMMHKLIDPYAIREIIASPTFSKDSFDREYVSRWSGSPKGAAFNSTQIRNQRILPRAELTYKIRADQKDSFYAVSADMAKDGDARTTVVVGKIVPSATMFSYRIVNIFDIKSSNYEVVANSLKHTLLEYKAKMFIYDANGIGAALRDWLNRDGKDENGEKLPAFGIINPPEKSRKDIRKVPLERTICYEVKASSGSINTNIHKLFFGRISSGAVTMLSSPSNAVANLKKRKWFNTATESTQKSYLRPHYFTDILEEELKNLDKIDMSDGQNNQVIKLKRRNLKIQKDYFSASEYLVWGVNQHLELKYYKRKYSSTEKLEDYIMIT